MANKEMEEAEQVARQSLEGDRTEYKEYMEQQQVKQQEENDKISNELKAIGILVMIFGTIASIYLAGQEYEYSFARFIILEIGTIISGMMFLGFSEIIQLLQDIKDKISK